jgi:hypothetical protein
MKTAIVVDGRNFLDPQALRDAGFEYEGIGLAGGESQAGKAAAAESAEARPR